MKKLNKKGVSLAELLAVVVIMGIIAAIAIPLVGNVIETSKKKAFLGDLVTVTEAARVYCITEGKDTEGICKKYKLTSSTPAAGSIQVTNGVVTFNDGDKTTAGDFSVTDTAKLPLYLSKPIGKIGGENTSLQIVTDGSKYYVRATNTAADDYITVTTPTTADVEVDEVAGDANTIALIVFIDPTDPNAINHIGKVVANHE